MIWWVSLLYRRFSDHYTYLNKFVTISFQRKLFHLHVAHDIHVKINQHIYDLSLQFIVSYVKSLDQ